MSSSSIPVSCNAEPPYKLDISNIVSSTSRKNGAGKPILRLSIPKSQQPQVQQHNSNKRLESQVNTQSTGETVHSNESTNKRSAKTYGDNKPNSMCNIDKINISKVNHEIEKLNPSERTPIGFGNQFNKVKASTSQTNFENVNQLSDTNSSSDVDSDSDKKCLGAVNSANMQNLDIPLYSKFENDFKRRIDEMNSNSHFDVQLKGKLVNQWFLVVLIL